MTTNLPPLTVRPFAAAHAAAWDAYVLAHPQGTLFHARAWSRAVERAYGHRPAHRTVWAGERLAGVLPLFEVRSAFVGTVLVSVPYGTYGGILADTPAARQLLLAAADEEADRIGARYVELRHREANDLALPETDRYVTFRKELPARVEDVAAFLPRKTRAAARKGARDTEVRFGGEHLDTAYDLYAYALRRLGSPNYRRAFLHALQAEHGDACVVTLACDAQGPVAGLISFIFRDEIIPYFTGSLPRGQALNANNAMHLRLMEWAVEHGIRRYDLNRSRQDNRGPYLFKCLHGFDPEPLHYQFSLHGARELPNLSPSNRRFALAGRIWRRLPLPLTRWVGGHVTKWIP